jgi:hypothetical protein
MSALQVTALTVRGRAVAVTSRTDRELRGLSPRANYTDRATAACRRSWCQLLRLGGVAWSAQRIPTAVFSEQEIFFLTSSRG